MHVPIQWFRCLHILTILIATSLLFARPALAQTYTVTDLGTLGGLASYAEAINASGQVAGYIDMADGSDHAFIWQNGNMTDLGTLGGASSIAWGINDAGQVVGEAYLADGSDHAILWQNGAMIDLGTLGGAYGASSYAYGINSSGQVVGSSWNTGHTDARAFLWQSGEMVDLGTLAGGFTGANGINASGQVVGESYLTNGSSHAFLWKNSSMTDLGTLGGSSSVAWGINAIGEVVGSSDNTDNVARTGEVSQALLWQNGIVSNLGMVAGHPEVYDANCINSHGQVVGGFLNTDGETTDAFVWQNGIMTDLNELVPVGTRGVLSYAAGINDAGEIVGYTNGGSAFLLTPKPPAIALTAPANNSVVKGTLMVTGSITDTTSVKWTLTCSGAEIGSGTGTRVSVSWDTTKVADGSHTLVLQETDAAGNTSMATVAVTVRN